ncbi:MAG: hypothetical protein M0P71_18030 [Melioribacteraceae bacterium]|jgi:transketolase|nr:hypothetical protein [Melioribacteraceae bacterium]
MTTQRDRFFQTIGNAYKNGRDDLVILTADMGAASLNEFKDDPNFLINIGPAEQLGACISAGLSLQGKKAYLYGIVPFITGRCLEQIMVSICSQNLPVTIVGSGSALSYDLAGCTHHGICDLGLMRCMPNLTICNGSSLEMVEYYANYSLGCKTPLYVRMDKKTYSYKQPIDKEAGYIFRKWPWNNDKPIIISTGAITNYLAEQLKPGIGLIEVFQFPFNELDLKYDIMNMKVVSVEEGYKIGGLGDSLSFLPNVTKIGFDNFCEAKPREEYWKILLREALNA